MTTEDLKVENANVRVSNANEEGRVYDIMATFTTSNGVLKRVEGGQVQKNGLMVASFYTGHDSDKSTTVTYMNTAHEDTAMQCELIQLISEFMSLSFAKAIAEAED